MVGKSLVFDFFSEIEGKYKNKKKKTTSIYLSTVDHKFSLCSLQKHLVTLSVYSALHSFQLNTK